MNKNLYDVMKELAITKMEEATTWLERENVTREFETLEELNTWKSERKDAEEKYKLFSHLLRTLHDAEEFEEYEIIMGVLK